MRPDVNLEQSFAYLIGRTERSILKNLLQFSEPGPIYPAWFLFPDFA